MRRINPAAAIATETPVALAIISQSVAISTNIGSIGTSSKEGTQSLVVVNSLGLSYGTEGPLDRQQIDNNLEELECLYTIPKRLPYRVTFLIWCMDRSRNSSQLKLNFICNFADIRAESGNPTELLVLTNKELPTINRFVKIESTSLLMIDRVISKSDRTRLDA